MAEIHTGQPGNTPFKENWHNKQITMEEEAKSISSLELRSFGYYYDECLELMKEACIKTGRFNKSEKVRRISIFVF